MRVREIQEVVAKHFGLPASRLRGRRRLNKLVVPRQIAIYLARELTPRSFTEIAREFNRDHTTAIHAVRRVEQLIENDDEILEDVKELRQKLETR